MQEKGLRLGCGFVFGLVLGVSYFLIDAAQDRSVFVIGTLAVAVVCAVAALRFGDSFWRWLGQNWRWWV